MYIIVGLGNPGKKYEMTRHNVGFMAIDEISKSYGIDVKSSKFSSECGCGIIGKEKTLLMKPQTFMNESGVAVREAMMFYKVSIDKIVVIFDDISFVPGRMRIKKNGTHGGHNGIKSIINLCGGENFTRVKIGVGNKPNLDWDLADWVLSNFSNDDMIKTRETLKKSVDAVKLILENNMQKAMNLYN